jgi:hypothetical protein
VNIVKTKKDCCIYVLQYPNSNFYKIGKTKDFEQRFRIISNSLPLKPIQIHKFYVTDISVGETCVHAHFVNKRINGEWFQLDKRDLKWVKSRERTLWIEEQIQTWKEKQKKKTTCFY